MLTQIWIQIIWHLDDFIHGIEYKSMQNYSTCTELSSYLHVGMVSSPSHTFFLGKLEQVVNQYFVHILSLVTDNSPSWMNQQEENDSRNYFMINLHESMEPGRDRTRDPWICSQTRICCQTHYRLRYVARCFMINLLRKYGTRPGSNTRPLDLQSDMHMYSDTLLTALCGQV